LICRKDVIALFVFLEIARYLSKKKSGRRGSETAEKSERRRKDLRSAIPLKVGDPLSIKDLAILGGGGGEARALEHEGGIHFKDERIC